MSNKSGWDKLKHLPPEDPRRQHARAFARKRMQRLKEDCDPRYWGSSSPDQAYASAWKSNLKLKYGITPAQYADMFRAQQGLCACCGHPETIKRGSSNKLLAVDHCHTTLRVRALLCHACNTGLGQFKDDPVRLSAAIAYIQTHIRS